ncbi:MAG: hypothetical protein KAG19_00425 [Methylococcales bacterium]|nr:hypothetical protein [Methylococcales bacterium]
MTLKHFIFLLFFFFPNRLSQKKTQLLFSASILGQMDTIKSLLSENVDVNSITKTGRSTIIRVVKVLLTYGADVNFSRRKC